MSKRGKKTIKKTSWLAVGSSVQTDGQTYCLFVSLTKLNIYLPQTYFIKLSEFWIFQFEFRTVSIHFLSLALFVILLTSLGYGCVCVVVVLVDCVHGSLWNWIGCKAMQCTALLEGRVFYLLSLEFDDDLLE